MEFKYPSQIVNIHFGLTDYGKMHFLVNIGKQLKQRYLITARKNKVHDDKQKQKFQKQLDKIEQNIDKEVLKIKKYEEKSNSEVVNAFVTLRSMEGKERTIMAYKGGKCKRFCLTNFCCQGKRFRKKM